MRRIALAAIAVLACAAPSAAQRSRITPARPALSAHADTNNAVTYYQHGASRLEADPTEAAAAFYWASRLRPGWAEPLYGRRVALLMSEPRRLVSYMEGSRSVARSPEVVAIDSLQLRALMLNPFLAQRFDRPMLRHYLTASVEENMRRNGVEPNRALAAYEVSNWLNSASPYMKAWFAYSEGRYPQAIGEYERALARARQNERVKLRTDLGRIHFFSGNFDRAVEHFTTATTESRKADSRDMVYVYESKALLEHSLGTVLQQKGDTAAAREAYGRALQEDLSFFPAHVALSGIALASGDTASALSAMDLAVQLSPENAAIHYEYALLLIRARKTVEAVAELKKAAEIEPVYAAPHLILGHLFDRSGAGFEAEALGHFRAYLARAPRDEAGRANAEARVAALTAAPVQP
ncbi:MAG TPA: tetratricopeptide repeat protein [Longimicrobium sp.]|nr:tetratricopeptide repeat protein [Longimicrobium sp.]